MEICEATYGAAAGSRSVVDRLRGAVSVHRDGTHVLRITATHSALGIPDPAHGHRKQLLVSVRHVSTDTVTQHEATEGGVMQIVSMPRPAPGAPVTYAGHSSVAEAAPAAAAAAAIRIASATFGSDSVKADVTAQLCRLVQCSAAVGAVLRVTASCSSIFGDASVDMHPKEKKELRLEYVITRPHSMHSNEVDQPYVMASTTLSADTRASGGDADQVTCVTQRVLVVLPEWRELLLHVPPPSAPLLTILSASWGTDTQRRDVTPYVTLEALTRGGGRAVSLPCENATFGGTGAPPAPSGEGPLHLAVTYTIAERPADVRVLRSLARGRMLIECPDPPRADAVLCIHRATYGSERFGSDVTGLVRRAISRDGTSVSLSVSNSKMGGDPHPGAQKTLEVSFSVVARGSARAMYTSDAAARIVRILEFGELDLHAPDVVPASHRLNITRATWGSQTHYADVTAALRRVVAASPGGASLRVVANSGSLCGRKDPCPGSSKQLYVSCTFVGDDGGEQSAVTLEDGTCVIDSPAPHAGGDAILVLSATFASKQAHAIVTAAVRAALSKSRRSLRLRVSAEALGVDPHPGASKALHIRYRFSDDVAEIRRVVVDEGGVVSIDAPPPVSPRAPIRVLDAFWGVYGTEHRADVTALVRLRAQGAACTDVSAGVPIPLYNETFGSVDPAPTQRKTLSVRYTRGEDPQEHIAHGLERGSLRLLPHVDVPPTAQPIIISAQWGTATHNVDVTPCLQAAVSTTGSGLLLYASVDALGCDPAHGDAKTLEVAYTLPRQSLTSGAAATAEVQHMRVAEGELLHIAAGSVVTFDAAALHADYLARVTPPGPSDVAHFKGAETCVRALRAGLGEGMYKDSFWDNPRTHMRSPRGDITVEWARPQEINPAAAFFSTEVGVFTLDLEQGVLGNCWLLAAVAAAVAVDPSALTRIFITPMLLAQGVLAARLWVGHRWHTIITDDRLPVLRGASVPPQYANRPAGVCNRARHCFWAALLEKCFARALGGYAALERRADVSDLAILSISTEGEALASLLPRSVPLSKVPLLSSAASAEGRTALWLQMAASCTPSASCIYPCAAGRSRTVLAAALDGVLAAARGSAQDGNGLIASHAYAVTAARVVTDASGRPHALVRLLNPWGCGEWRGPWSDGDTQRWTPALASALGHVSRDDGVFWMEFDDMIKFDFSLFPAAVPRYVEDGGTWYRYCVDVALLPSGVATFSVCAPTPTLVSAEQMVHSSGARKLNGVDLRLLDATTLKHMGAAVTADTLLGGKREYARSFGIATVTLTTAATRAAARELARSDPLSGAQRTAAVDVQESLQVGCCYAVLVQSSASSTGDATGATIRVTVITQTPLVNGGLLI